MLIAFWLEARLTKDEILERYLSNVYFGDNVYGLRAASLHYFYRQPERLTLSRRHRCWPDWCRRHRGLPRPRTQNARQNAPNWF